MSSEREPQEHPPLLPLGTQVGDWRVVERHGRGAYGELYRAVRSGQEDAGPVALKVSVYPWDQRFVREAELLARLRHPGVPKLPAYHSAEASLFYLRLVRDRDAYYPPAPADDVYALGVTAYRLVMGEYPPPMEPHQDEEGHWSVTSADPRPLLESHARVEPRLRELILRMLSASPQERGTTAELAAALEGAAVPQPRPEASAEKTESPEPHAPERAQRLWPVLVAAGVAGLLLWAARPEP